MENKITICVKPTQSGKTTEMITLIKNYISQDNKNGKSVHIVIEANILNVMEQTSDRIHNEFTESNIIQISSKVNKNKFYSTDSAHTLLLNITNPIDRLNKWKNIQIINMLSHDKRKEDLIELLECFEEYTRYERVYIYFDELHHYINTWRDTIDMITKYNKVKNIVGYTATPYKIWDEENTKWLSVNMNELFYTIDPNIYVGCDDAIWETDCFHNDNYLDDIMSILFDNKILESNNRILIIGKRTNITHNDIKDLVLKINPLTVVCLINKNNKCLFINNIIHKFNEESMELGEKIYSILEKESVLERPLVIIGNICIGIGQTFAHDKLGNLNYGIFPFNNINRDTDYQQCGRIFGNHKRYSNYRQPTIFCNPSFKNNCIDLEFCSKNLCNFMGSEITLDVYRANVLKEIENKFTKSQITKLHRCGEIPFLIKLDQENMEKLLNIKNKFYGDPVMRLKSYIDIIEKITFDNKATIMDLLNNYYLSLDNLINENTSAYIKGCFLHAKRCIETNSKYGNQGFKNNLKNKKQLRIFLNSYESEFIVCYYDWSKGKKYENKTLKYKEELNELKLDEETTNYIIRSKTAKYYASR